MKIASTTILLSGLLVCGCARRQASTTGMTGGQQVVGDASQLDQRVARLEQQVRELSQLVEPLRTQQAVEERQRRLRVKFENKLAEDGKKYSQEQLGEAERLYQVANRKWGSAEATESLQAMITKYPDINRTGCAVLYVAQMSKGDERARYLRDCIDKYNNCFYGDGVQVGVYARFLLMQDLRSQGEKERAAALEAEIKTKYADAIDHGGHLLVEMLN